MSTANNPDNNLSPSKPGQSGNPSGRPRGTRDLAGYVIETTDGGKELVDLCVLATDAGHRGDFAALDIKYLGQEAARRPEFAGLVLLVCALGTAEVGGDHNFISWGKHRCSEPPQFSERHSQAPRKLAPVPNRQYNSW